MPACVEGAHDVGQVGSSPSRRTAISRRDARAWRRRSGSSTSTTVSVSASSAGSTSTVGRPISALSAAGVPSATMWPWSMIPTRSARHVGLLEVLGGEEDGDAVLGRQAADLLPQRAAALRVEAGRRLVEEQDAGPVDEREREVEPALHAARVAADACGRRPPSARRARAARRRASRARPCGMPVQRGLEPHVLAAGEERVERGLLERGADRRAHARRPRARRRGRRPAPCPRSAAAAS